MTLSNSASAEATTHQVLVGDCVEYMREMAPASIDSVVTDPPYGIDARRAVAGPEGDLTSAPMLGMQSANWHERATHSRGYADNDPAAFQAWCEVWLRECRRVLKPGGHLVAFGGTRTWHRLASAVEDVGFEIRDSLAWIYTSGFPKSVDVAKVVGEAQGDASGWHGWGTALKPAHEPIVLARKHLDGTIAQNVLKHGVGVLNIESARVDGGGLRRWPSNVEMDQSRMDELAHHDRSISHAFWVSKPSAGERVRVDGITHPTVKPLALQARLVRLVTPAGGLVLDPFAGSGSTAEACSTLGMRSVSIEREAEYARLIEYRLDRRSRPTSLAPTSDATPHLPFETAADDGPSVGESGVSRRPDNQN